jgi:hypothetical protein
VPQEYEYNGQLIGGPDDGNVVSTDQREFPVIQIMLSGIDGRREPMVTTVVSGNYRWDSFHYRFVWIRHGTE